jgi:hypothetical protein
MKNFYLKYDAWCKAHYVALPVALLLLLLVLGLLLTVKSIVIQLQ